MCQETVLKASTLIGGINELLPFDIRKKREKFFVFLFIDDRPGAANAIQVSPLPFENTHAHITQIGD